MEEKLFIQSNDYNSYSDNKSNISENSIVFIEEQGKEKLIEHGKEFDFVPSGGSNGQVLTKTSDGYNWETPSGNADWDATENENGYIKNKPFGVSPITELIKLENVYLQKQPEDNIQDVYAGAIVGENYDGKPILGVSVINTKDLKTLINHKGDLFCSINNETFQVYIDQDKIGGDDEFDSYMVTISNCKIDDFNSLPSDIRFCLALGMDVPVNEDLQSDNLLIGTGLIAYIFNSNLDSIITDLSFYDNEPSVKQIDPKYVFPQGEVGQVLVQGENGIEWKNNVSSGGEDLLTKEEASELYQPILEYVSNTDINEIFDELYNTGEEVTPTLTADFNINNSHKIMSIDGHNVIAAVINNHKYLIALEDAFQTLWKSSTTDISAYAPYVTTATTGGEWTFEEGKNILLVCGQDYYNLEQINHQIVVGSNEKGIGSAALQCRNLKIGGYTWNMANFEVLNYLYLNFDELLSNTDLNGKNIWLPYALNANNCWKVSISSSTSSSIKCNRNGINYSEYVIPVALIY